MEISNLQGMINNIFIEFKSLFFRNPRVDTLEDIYIQHQKQIPELLQKGILVFSSESYCNIFDLLLNLGIAYENFDTNDINEEDLTIFKKQIIKSIIRVMFSKEKYIFLRKENLISLGDFEEKYNYSEFNFLNKLIYKDLMLVLQQCGDEPTMIFKKRNIYDDLLKEIFYFYGNETIIHSFVEPFSNLLSNLRQGNDKLKALDEENFEVFINDLVINLKEYLPPLLKIILKLIYKISNELFSLNSMDFFQILYFMFFSFLCSEEVLEIYENISKHSDLIIEIQKILNNLINNNHFPIDSPYTEFNDVIDIYYNKLKNFIKQNIFLLNENSTESKQILRNIAMKNELKMPNFLFYVDCQNILAIAPGGFSDLITYEKI